MRSLVGSGTSSYSGCGCVTHGGDRAFSISRAHTGGMLGSAAPAAISTIAIANCITPTASAMQWHTWMPKIIPPHESHQGPIDDVAGGALRLAEKLVATRDRRAQRGAKVVEPDVGVGLHEDGALAGALDD
ncbi:hypothetical protein ACMD2_09174 [Ananas comosus]|uniref:Uncharacterized protein n=1 Tax=Ananas comosus TaxID=4615 RepID=A0A199V165_ANACO|nr:hypothetical protein ACMD2_09174 [Ananas comosus]